MQIHKCGWCLGNELYEAYHDDEWGVPVTDDATLFELLVLETFQAGLSWLTILKKRENFRKAFDNFDYKKISTYKQSKIDAFTAAGVPVADKPSDIAKLLNTALRR